MSLTCGLLTQVSDLRPHGPLVCCCKTYVVALIISAVFGEKREGIVIALSSLASSVSASACKNFDKNFYYLCHY